MLTHVHALLLQPWQGSFGSLFYALGLNVECTNSTFELTEPSGPKAANLPIHSDAQATYYVDYAQGSDSNTGSISSPFKTLLRGLGLVCARLLGWDGGSAGFTDVAG